MSASAAASRLTGLAPTLTGALAAALVGACTVGPDYREPPVVLPDAIGMADAPGIVEGRSDSRWWQAFKDPELDGLLAAALAANHDIRIATANLRASRQLLREGSLGRLPIVTATASGTRERRSAAAGFAGAPGVGQPETFYDAGFDASWEIDFAGRSRRGVEALGADFEAELASRADVLVSVTAEVVRTYIELRGQQYRLAVARDNLANQQETWELTRALLDGGRGTDLDIARARAQLETTRAGIPPLEEEIDRSIHRLGVLVGRPPAALRGRLGQAGALPRATSTITVDDPETLLRQRPDIRIAERRLAAATARVGFVVADLFPRVSLFGSFGYQATSLSDLGDDEAERFQFGPRITWAAFDLGRVRARIAAADERAEAALAEYEQTVLLALEDAENSVGRYSHALQRQARLAIAAEASGQAAELARLRYRNGADSFLTVLDAERRLLEAQDLFAQAETDATLAMVSVYKALGVGWE